VLRTYVLRSKHRIHIFLVRFGTRRQPRKTTRDQSVWIAIEGAIITACYVHRKDPRRVYRAISRSVGSLIFKSSIGIATTALLAASTDHVIPCFSELTAAKIKIAILVPSVIPDYGRIYADGVASPRGGYTVNLDYTADCDGAGACSAGYILGVPSSSKTPPPGYSSMKLSDGSTGYYTDHGCGANCEGSFELQFFRRNAKYSIFLNGGNHRDGLLIESGMKTLR
jgi:hypothetical protein